ncbi:MAG: hypothetical protein L0154_07300 [Chloroflexi bacterium]|nr:hypothetical protein [Chloroflexota bacterium]
MPERKADYISEWKQIFYDMLGWTDEQTMNWVRANGYDQDLDGEFSVLLFEPPIFWTFNEFIPKSLQQSVGQVLDLRTRLYDIFEETDTSRDYVEYRARVLDMLADFDETLPQSAS